jgi:hypothetical protein
VFEVVFFPESLGGGELGFFAMTGAAILLVSHPAEEPDLFTAQETQHPNLSRAGLCRPIPASPILTAGTRTEAVLSEENLRVTRTTEGVSKVYY